MGAINILNSFKIECHFGSVGNFLFAIYGKQCDKFGSIWRYLNVNGLRDIIFGAGEINDFKL